MSIYFNINGRNTPYKLSSFENEHVFLMENDNGEKIEINTPLKINLSFKDKEFEVHFLAKNGVKESDIFQVHVKEKRIGWLIPAISFGSNDHDFAEDTNFLSYVYVGMRGALKKLDDSIYTQDLNIEESISFSDIFHEFTVLLIISKETLNSNVQFDIDRASPSLIKHGYFKLSNINPGEIAFKAESPQNKKLSILQISYFLSSHKLISELLNNYFAYEKKAVFKFFFIYQIIELLIDDVFKNEQKKIIDHLVSVRDDSGLAKEALEKIRDSIAEKQRIGLLVKNYSNMNGNLSDLKHLCNEFLIDIGRTEGNEFQEYFYKIRNFIFHQYRDFQSMQNDTALENIIKEFIEILPTMLSNYQPPTAN
ncbi:hypothetical protein KFZ76_08230 [Methylovulum psychrotolerans]|uniref:hypothetical protein n=1 Tax=Methylovulum psychrotolerans TaxID=1704499 RepID=UPI001BFFD35E|nr:hypothetical protein [Methylovulum psychrotolerans]MBT9097693.1 hypothetical protein [Methylovulum psychrotolerans]